MNKRQILRLCLALLVGVLIGLLVIAPLTRPSVETEIVTKLTEARDIHQQWSEWYDDMDEWIEENPGEPIPVEYELMGDQEYQDEWIEVYEAAVAALEVR